MKGGVSKKEKLQTAHRKEAAVLNRSNRSFAKLPTLHRGGGDGAFSVICFDIILQRGPPSCFCVTGKPVFTLSEAEGDLR